MKTITIEFDLLDDEFHMIERASGANARGRGLLAPDRVRMMILNQARLIETSEPQRICDRRRKMDDHERKEGGGGLLARVTDKHAFAVPKKYTEMKAKPVSKKIIRDKMIQQIIDPLMKKDDE